MIPVHGPWDSRYGLIFIFYQGQIFGELEISETILSIFGKKRISLFCSMRTTWSSFDIAVLHRVTKYNGWLGTELHMEETRETRSAIFATEVALPSSDAAITWPCSSTEEIPNTFRFQCGFYIVDHYGRYR